MSDAASNESINDDSPLGLLIKKHNIEFAHSIIMDFLVGPREYLRTIYTNAIHDMIRFIQFPLEWYITKHLDKHVDNNLLQYKLTMDRYEQRAVYRLSWKHSLGSEDLIFIVGNRLDYISFDENLQLFFTIGEDFKMIDFFLQMMDTRAFYIEL